MTDEAKTTMEERFLALLADREWHGSREIALKVSHRFSAYKFTLEAKGYTFEKRLDPDRPKGKVWWQYRWTPNFGGQLWEEGP